MMRVEWVVVHLVIHPRSYSVVMAWLWLLLMLLSMIEVHVSTLHSHVRVDHVRMWCHMTGYQVLLHVTTVHHVFCNGDLLRPSSSLLVYYSLNLTLTVRISRVGIFIRIVGA